MKYLKLQKHLLLIAYFVFSTVYLTAQPEKGSKQNRNFNNQKADSICYKVSGAGTSDVNGIYKPAGKERGFTVYSNGKYKLYYKGCHSKWMIEGNNGHNMYRNFIDSPIAPANKWEKACGQEALPPAPTLEVIKSDEVQAKSTK
ncbi:MAG TPA: hypothetical protein PK252_11010 [Bacteroidales bacterium]|nr:hypothetical protein [Bacteroidales bacterium]